MAQTNDDEIKTKFAVSGRNYVATCKAVESE